DAPPCRQGSIISWSSRWPGPTWKTCWRRMIGILKGHTSRVETTGSVYPGSRMGRGGAEVESFHGGAITKIRKGGTEEQLLIEVRAAAAQVAPDQVFIHLLQVARRVDGPPPNQAAEPGSEPLDALLDAIRERFTVLVPASFRIRGSMGVGPEGMASRR